MKLYVSAIKSPLGELLFAAREEGLCALDFSEVWPRAIHHLRRTRGKFTLLTGDPLGVASRLTAYFAGRLDAVADLADDPKGTPFQLHVWTELRRIPAGGTISYRELARRVRRPGASRAVGSANRRNPVAIVVPCHRVVGSDGALRGYAGGLERKGWLLAHEARYAGTDSAHCQSPLPFVMPV
jgi:methylated-DNA-[protein]-cysteine S-methyltransferase